MPRFAKISGVAVVIGLSILYATGAYGLPIPTPYPVTDSFSGSGSLSADWTNMSSADQGYVPLAQNSGTVAPSVSGQQGLATYIGASFSNDQYAQATLVAHSSAAGSTGVCVRMNAAGSGVCYLADGGLMYALANGAGAYVIASSCPIPASGDTIQLLVVGTTYTCTDVTTGSSASATDGTYPTGNPGILVDQRNSIVYALAQFQADCSPSCGVNTLASSPITAPYPVTDSFSGWGGLSADWTNTSSAGQEYVPLAQNSGAVVPSVSGQQGLATYTGASFSNDQYAQATFLAHSSAAGSTGVCVRMNVAGSGVCYLADWGLIYSLANGAGTDAIITSGCPIPASGDTIRLLVVGTTYTCIDVTTGSSASATDGTYPTGNPGILVDQRNSIVYALAQFQADCSPSCGVNTLASSPITAPYPVTDSFSGWGGLSADWTNTSSAGQEYVPLAQNSGAVVPSVSGQQGLATYTGASFSNDQYAQATFLAHSSAAGSTGVCVRMNVAGSGVCYLADWGLIYSLANGAGTDAIITSGCPIPASGDTIRLLVVGTTYTCIDVTTGDSVSGTDATYPTGNPGILVDQRNSTVYALAQFQADCSPSCGGIAAASISVTLTPATVTLPPSQPQAFTATVAGTSDTAVTWSLTPAAGSISAAGLYTAPALITAAQTVTVTAFSVANPAASASATVQLNVVTPTLNINATSIPFGPVVVNTTSTQLVTLTSTGTAPVTIAAATVTGMGYTISGGAFPVTLNPTQAVTLNVLFDPTVTGWVSGQLTITSNSSTNSMAVIPLSGIGEAASYSVNLSWDAPSSSADPVVGYNVYRSSSGSSTYQLLNSSVDNATTYVDSTVQAGLTYDYFVESVDASGVESSPSNMVSVSIP